MGAEGRGQLVMHKGRHSGVNFSRFLSQCKVLSFLFEDESSFCGLLEEKKKRKKRNENEACKLARGHSVSNAACVHLSHVPEISTAIGVCCTPVWNLK